MDIRLEFRPQILYLRIKLRPYAPHLNPQEASQPKDGGQRRAGMRQFAAFTVLQGVSAMGSVCPMT